MTVSLTPTQAGDYAVFDFGYGDRFGSGVSFTPAGGVEILGTGAGTFNSNETGYNPSIGTGAQSIGFSEGVIQINGAALSAALINPAPAGVATSDLIFSFANTKIAFGPGKVTF